MKYLPPTVQSLHLTSIVNHRVQSLYQHDIVSFRTKFPRLRALTYDLLDAPLRCMVWVGLLFRSPPPIKTRKETSGSVAEGAVRRPPPEETQPRPADGLVDHRHHVPPLRMGGTRRGRRPVAAQDRAQPGAQQTRLRFVGGRQNAALHQRIPFTVPEIDEFNAKQFVSDRMVFRLEPIDGERMAVRLVASPASRNGQRGDSEDDDDGW